MKNIIGIFTFVLLFSVTALQAESDGNEVPTMAAHASMSGYVIDKVSGEGLAGATITIDGTETKIFTDFEGRFSVNGLVPGKYDLKVSYISYEEVTFKQFDLFGSETLNVKLATNGNK